MGLLELIRSDVRRYSELHGRRSIREQGLWAIVEYRLGHWACHEGPPLGRVLLRPLTMASQLLIEILTGIQISHHARIGPGFYIAHFGGVFINEKAVIGKHVGISHGVVVGEERTGAPHIGDDVSIHTCALLIGGIRVGDGATIGAGALVREDVPPGATAVGVPVDRIIRHKQRGKRAAAQDQREARDLSPPETV